MTYSNKTKRILNELRHRVRSAREIFEAIFPNNPDTFKITKRLLGYLTPPKKLDYRALKRLEEKRFYTLLAKLHKEGVVKKQGMGAHALWQLTAGGLKKLVRYAKKHHLATPKRKYSTKKISDKILIIFDIPEGLKHYRDWIRYQLSSLGFVMLQKSVWIGSYQIPADFIYDLKELNLMQYIYIFKVTKSGSMID